VAKSLLHVRYASNALDRPASFHCIRERIGWMATLKEEKRWANKKVKGNKP
jgi:hypothetical protein